VSLSKSADFEHIVTHADHFRCGSTLLLSPTSETLSVVTHPGDEYGEDASMRLTDFNVLTFDCYGTLIDWETGILASLRPLLSNIPSTLSEDVVLEVYAEAESAQENETPTMRYSELLQNVYRNLARHWGTEVSEQECVSFGNSVAEWPAFEDSCASLHYLKQHYKLVILSNVDRKSFAGSNQKLQVEFDAIYTAEDIGSYKPDRRNFDYLVSHLRSDFGIEKPHILHTAQSLFHDHVPANAAGLATAWIDRRHDKNGWGATKPPPSEAKIDFHFHSLADLVKAHQHEMDS
jgi:2-haloalkanoic acid dehalogenase type II